MCHYTIKFFECDHKTDDNVKGCSIWEKTGTHCDIDNPQVKRRKECSIRSEDVGGLCPRCQSNERAQILREQEEERIRIQRREEQERIRFEREREEEPFRRDLEKVKVLDQEEQRRNTEAHEAHLKRVQEDSEVAWRARYEAEVSSFISFNNLLMIEASGSGVHP